jgi:hypothetical protein
MRVSVDQADEDFGRILGLEDCVEARLIGCCRPASNARTCHYRNRSQSCSNRSAIAKSVSNKQLGQEHVILADQVLEAVALAKSLRLVRGAVAGATSRPDCRRRLRPAG